MCKRTAAILLFQDYRAHYIYSLFTPIVFLFRFWVRACSCNMNTLTTIEAERVDQILKHAIDRLTILSYIPTVWNDDLVVDIKCAPILNSLEKLWMCEEQVKEIDLNAGATGVKDITLLKQVHRLTRACCRNFIADRPTLQILMSSQPESQSGEFMKFIKYLNELRSQVKLKLMTTVEEEAANRTLLHELTEKERKHEDERDVLQGKLDKLREERETVCNGLDGTLHKLQHELQEVTIHNNTELEMAQKEMNEAIAKATADHELRMRQLQDRVDAMERQVHEVVEKNKEEEQRMRREKSRIESALNSKISQYDEDMDSRQKTLNKFQTKFTEESSRFGALKEHFDKIDADIARMTEEDTLLTAVRRREEFGAKIVFRAAASIQKIFRGRQARKVVTAMKAKSKKGKKGKKK